MKIIGINGPKTVGYERSIVNEDVGCGCYVACLGDQKASKGCVESVENDIRSLDVGHTSLYIMHRVAVTRRYEHRRCLRSRAYVQRTDAGKLG